MFGHKTVKFAAVLIVVQLAALPQQLRTVRSKRVDRFEHGIVYRTRAERAPQHQECLPSRRQRELIEGFLPAFFTVKYRRPHGIAGKNYLILRKYALQSFICNTYLCGAFCQYFVGDSGKTVLFLYQRRHTGHGCGEKHWPAGISSGTDSYIGTEITNHFTRTPQTRREFKRNCQVGQGQRTLYPRYRQPYYPVPGFGNACHLHTAFSSNEKDFGIRMARPEPVGYRHRREYMPACTSSAEYYPVFSVYLSHFCLTISYILIRFERPPAPLQAFLPPASRVARFFSPRPPAENSLLSSGLYLS